MSFADAFFAELRPRYIQQNGPGDGPFKAVRREALLDAARACGFSEIQAMLTCLERDIWPLRFARNRGVFSHADQTRLLKARVAVIGCGGLGGYVIELLARAGIGNFTVCDPDSFDESNLNRQNLCTLDTLGRNKAMAAAEFLQRVAPHAGVRALAQAAQPHNLAEIIYNADIVLDCLDSLEARFQAEAAAHAKNLPFVHGAVAGNEGFALLSRPGEPGLSGLYGQHDAARKKTDAPPQPGSNTNAGTRLQNGAESKRGVQAFSPPAVAAVQSWLAVDALLGRPASGGLIAEYSASGKAGSGSLVHLDLALSRMEAFAL